MCAQLSCARWCAHAGTRTLVRGKFVRGQVVRRRGRRRGPLPRVAPRSVGAAADARAHSAGAANAHFQQNHAAGAGRTVSSFAVVADTHSKAHPATEQRIRELGPNVILHAGALSRLGLTAADADDGAQIVFGTFARRIEDVAPGSEFHFLLGTARRVAASLRRTLHRRRENEEDYGSVESEFQDFASPEQLLERKREPEQLSRVLSKMSHERRSVLILFTVEGVSWPQIASPPVALWHGRLTIQGTARFRDLLAPLEVE